MTRRRAARVTAIGSAAVIAVTLLVVVVLVVTFIRRPLPERGGEVTLPGLAGPVTVLRDDQGVPQIYADNAADLMRVQGYVHAQDRFFEMDLRRHITAGQLSELVGANDDALRADAVVRTLGWRRVAQEELAVVSPRTRQYLQAYADGVNDYLRGKSASDLSVSYTMLARANPLPRIRPWTPVDSLAWLKAMAWDLRKNYAEELERARAITTVKAVTRVSQLHPAYPFGRHEPIVTTAAGAAGAPDGSQDDGGRGGAGDKDDVSEATEVGQSLGDVATSVAGGAGGVPPAGSGKAGSAPPASVEEALLTEPAQRAFTAVADAMDAVPGMLGRGEGIGSNSWVVSGDLTTTGKPLLANDPHLGTSIPGIWHQSGLHCRRVTEECPFDVAGFGFAGMPGIVIGHNARIAWGLTNLYPDVTDFYLERLAGDQVESGGTMKPLTTRKETIARAGSEPVTITVRETAHGPLLSDAIESVAEDDASAQAPGQELDRSTTYGVALAWTALKPGRTMDAIFEMGAASNFEEFRRAALLLDAPAQNVVYADAEGHIGYQAPGRIPVRGPGRPGSPVPSDGTWPHPGWDAAYDWQGTMPSSRLPFVLDPQEGFIVAANQAVTGPNGGPRLTSDWDYGYRSDRIRRLLEDAKGRDRKVSVADMRAMQTDTRNGIAELLVPLLLQVYDSQAPTQDTRAELFTSEAVDLLRGWKGDYTQPTDSAAAAYFNVVWATVLNLTFSDELPEGLRPDGGDRWFEVVRTLIENERDPWWDDLTTPGLVETRDEVLRRALVQARLQLTSTLGKDADRWEWGRLHRVRLEQTPLGGAGVPGLVHPLVNRGPYAAPGGSSVVNAFAWDASTNTFDVVAAPSMRMIVDLQNLDRSRWVNQTGVSGHPADAHYDDQIEAWLEGDDYAWPFTERAVRDAADGEQRFRPPASG